jgi:hypothetical protein
MRPSSLEACALLRRRGAAVSRRYRLRTGALAERFKRIEDRYEPFNGQAPIPTALQAADVALGGPDGRRHLLLS